MPLPTGSDYPGAIDGVSNGYGAVADGDVITANFANDQTSAILAVETVLGTNPLSGTPYATVAAALPGIIAAIQTQGFTFATDTGAANAYAVALSPTPPTYTAGQGVMFVATYSNTGASTLAVNGQAATAIHKDGSTALAAGDIVSGQVVWAIYDGTDFQLMGSSALSQSFLTVNSESSLADARQVTAGSGIQLTDGGAGSTLTVANTLSTGLSGGQTVLGDTAAGGNLTVMSTRNGTIGSVFLNGNHTFVDAGGNLTTPNATLTGGTLTFPYGSTIGATDDLALSIYTTSTLRIIGADYVTFWESLPVNVGYTNEQTTYLLSVDNTPHDQAGLGINAISGQTSHMTDWMVDATVVASVDGGGNLSITGRAAIGGNCTIDGTLSVAAIAGMTTALPVTEGGTGLNAVATGDVLYGSAADTISRLAAGTNGDVLTLSGGVPTWAPPSETMLSATNEFRLTLTSGTPVAPDSLDVSTATNLYLTPYRGNRIALFDGTSWAIYTSSEMSLSVSSLYGDGTTDLYDIFVYNNSGTPTLELGPQWTNLTTRATGLVLQDDVWAKSGDTTRRYVGTLAKDATETIEDSVFLRYLYNADNRVPRMMNAVAYGPVTTSSTTWATASGFQAPFVVGLINESFSFTATALATGASPAAAELAAGIINGYFESGSTPDPLSTLGSTTGTDMLTSLFSKLPDTVGFNSFAVYGRSNTSGTSVTLYGDPEDDDSWFYGNAIGIVWM